MAAAVAVCGAHVVAASSHRPSPRRPYQDRATSTTHHGHPQHAAYCHPQTREAHIEPPPPLSVRTATRSERSQSTTSPRASADASNATLHPLRAEGRPTQRRMRYACAVAAPSAVRLVARHNAHADQPLQTREGHCVSPTRRCRHHAPPPHEHKPAVTSPPLGERASTSKLRAPSAEATSSAPWTRNGIGGVAAAEDFRRMGKECSDASEGTAHIPNAHRTVSRRGGH